MDLNTTYRVLPRTMLSSPSDEHHRLLASGEERGSFEFDAHEHTGENSPLAEGL